jgi:hypothetical protein
VLLLVQLVADKTSAMDRCTEAAASLEQTAHTGRCIVLQGAD